MLPPVRTKWEILGTASDRSIQWGHLWKLVSAPFFKAEQGISEKKPTSAVSLRESVKTLHENKKRGDGQWEPGLRLPTILPEEEQIIDADQNLGKDIKTWLVRNYALGLGPQDILIL